MTPCCYYSSQLHAEAGTVTTTWRLCFVFLLISWLRLYILASPMRTYLCGESNIFLEELIVLVSRNWPITPTLTWHFTFTEMYTNCICSASHKSLQYTALTACNLKLHWKLSTWCVCFIISSALSLLGWVENNSHTCFDHFHLDSTQALMSINDYYNAIILWKTITIQL